MNSNDDFYWSGLEPGKLGVRFMWTQYLPYLLEDNDLVDEWEEHLRSVVAVAAGEALATDSDRVDWSTEISQVGSAAQEYQEIFLWLQDVPREVLTGLLVLGAERKLSAFYGYIRHRVRYIKRRFAGRDVTVEDKYHPDVLVELCKEHAIVSYGATPTSQTIWVQKSSKTLSDPERYQIPGDQCLIVLGAEDREYSYLVDERARVIEHRIDHVLQDAPELIPEIQAVSEDDVPVAIPSDFNWPTQDGVNRSNHIAILAGGRSHLSIPDEFTKPFLQQVVREAISEILPELRADIFSVEDHEIGPAAGSIEDFIVTLFENRETFAQAIGALADTWALYEIVSRVRRKLLSDHATTKNSGEPVRFFLPAGTLTMLCEEYVRRNYHPRAQLKSEWYCLTREFWYGYVSPGHPNAIIEYLVLVKTSQETYRFKALGTGEVLAHSVKRGRLDTDLPIPNLFEEKAN